MSRGLTSTGKVRHGWWRTRAGGILRVREMLDEHLVNAIRVLERYAEVERLRGQLAPCPFPDDTQAAYHFEDGQQALEEMASEELVPKLAELYAEREWREARCHRR